MLFQKTIEPSFIINFLVPFQNILFYHYTYLFTCIQYLGADGFFYTIIKVITSFSFSLLKHCDLEVDPCCPFAVTRRIAKSSVRLETNYPLDAVNEARPRKSSAVEYFCHVKT